MNTDSAPPFSACSHAAAWKEGPSGESNASSSADQGQLGLRHWRRLRHGQESRRTRAKVMCKANSSKRLLCDNSNSSLCDGYLCLVGPRQPAAATAKWFSVAKIAQRSGAIFASEDRCASQRQGRRSR
jgi:hypothetical protein